MGREIRRVPSNYEHPRKMYFRYNGYKEDYVPLYGKSYKEAAENWITEFIKYQAFPENPEYPYYWDWHGMPPNKEDYISYEAKDATWWQCYETVSEGTPVSPSFATAEELIDYLATYGDFWEQARAKEEERPVRPAPRHLVEKFVQDGYAFSVVFKDGQVATGIDSIGLLE